jgi:glucose dehydrogenase
VKPALLLLGAGLIAAQGLDPAELMKPPTANWPMFNGDYSGRRYSTLSQINKNNAGSLTMAWAFQSHAANLKGTPLEVNGVVYFSAPDNVWAVDARTGRRLWHYERPSEGDHIASRGVAMYKNRLYFGTPDAHLICLDARTGKELWNVVVADVAFGYYLSVAPLVIKDRVIIGTSGDSADVRISWRPCSRRQARFCGAGTVSPRPASPAPRRGPIRKR